MEPPQQNTVNLRRIVFFDITDNSFEWRSESSADSGKTWEVNTYGQTNLPHGDNFAIQEKCV